MRKTDVLEVVSRKLAPFMMLFGFYLVANGHYSPGGGFQGGVVIASAAILLLLCHDESAVAAAFPILSLQFAEIIAFFIFIAVGIIGLLLVGAFLGIFLPTGTGTTIADSGFVFLLNLIIGVKVGSGITLICFYIFRER